MSEHNSHIPSTNIETPLGNIPDTNYRYRPTALARQVPLVQVALLETAMPDRNESDLQPQNPSEDSQETERLWGRNLRRTVLRHIGEPLLKRYGVEVEDVLTDTQFKAYRLLIEGNLNHEIIAVQLEYSKQVSVAVQMRRILARINKFTQARDGSSLVNELRDRFETPGSVSSRRRHARLAKAHPVPPDEFVRAGEALNIVRLRRFAQGWPVSIVTLAEQLEARGPTSLANLLQGRTNPPKDHCLWPLFRLLGVEAGDAQLIDHVYGLEREVKQATQRSPKESRKT